MTECVHAFCICIYRCSHFFFFLTLNASGHTSDEVFSSLAILYAHIPGRDLFTVWENHRMSMLRPEYETYNGQTSTD